MQFKLVIVDDAAFIREAMKATLADTEFSFVGEATDGVQALDIIEKMQPDVVLLDLILPKKNGIEVSKEILEKWPSIKIVACSTEGQEAMMIQAIDAGCCNFLTKPFTSESLKKVLRAAVEPPRVRKSAFGGQSGSV